MEILMASVLYFLLVSVISSVEGLHSDPSSHIYTKEYGMQQTAGAPIRLVSGTMEVCLSASRIINSRETLYVHVCPSDGSSCTPELCYITSVPKCFIQEIYTSRAKCNSTSDLLVAGQSITVTFYEIDIGDTVPQDCFVIFDSDGRPDRNIKSCDGGCDFEPVNRPVTPPTMPPTTQPTQPAFCRDNCRRFLPSPFEGCFTCQRGFANPPRCCDPSTVAVVESASQPPYHTKQRCTHNAENGVCKKGFKEPDCCRCESSLTLRNGQCHQSDLKEELFTAIEDVLAKFQT